VKDGYWIEVDAGYCKTFRRGPFDTPAQARDAKAEIDLASVVPSRIITLDVESPTWRGDGL
jgi:hypothetical protein